MFLTGCCINGGQGSLNTIAAMFYPTAIRATGIGWALGVGRIGAVIGPAVGGILVGAAFSSTNVVLANILPAVIGVIAIALFNLRHAAQARPRSHRAPPRNDKDLRHAAQGMPLPGRA